MPLTPAERLEIRELYARYCHAIDDGDGAAWAECFVRDGSFVPGIGAARGTSIVGREALAAFGADARRGAIGRIVTTNLALYEGDGTVTGRCYGMLVEVRDGRPELVASVVYHDELEREDGAWRFRSRRPRRDH